MDVKLNSREEASESRLMTKSKRKKIFEDNSNLRKDYTPERTASPSPFKSNIRSRIFDKTPERRSKIFELTPERSRSRNSRIFTKTKTPERRHITHALDIKINNQ